ncbi:MAG: hypothetical protein JHC26_03310 [Thermofilum sp.]|jgi:hypothetical protein|uniref:hypothetical protein n=1 Tax=Thermofilum sp. TaxID=1961369 RepID=UPI00258460FE|nr:hypothetical protein [Thermofilum sp.]MCI4408097.1 hypothetical protein [Thermofilum sp.]
MQRLGCTGCVYFKPHVYVPYIGFCNLYRTDVIDRAAPCESFKPVSLEDLAKHLEENGWLYCINCRKIITTREELEKHFQEHVIAKEVVIDTSVGEEAGGD